MKIKKKLLSAIASAVLVASAQSAGATTLLYNDFSNPAGLQLNGNASAPVTDDQNRQVLRLTPANFGQSVLDPSHSEFQAGASRMHFARGGISSPGTPRRDPI